MTKRMICHDGKRFDKRLGRCAFFGKMRYRVATWDRNPNVNNGFGNMIQVMPIRATSEYASMKKVQKMYPERRVSNAYPYDFKLP